MLSFYLSALESAADKEDFRALYRRYHGVMERTALAILQNPRDAEEAVQEAFIRVIENFSKIYEIPCKNLGAWLVTIVRNEAITMLRRRRDHLPLDEDWAGFERQARDAPDYASLVALFARLPETYRAALEMKLLLGYSGAEIARRLLRRLPDGPGLGAGGGVLGDEPGRNGSGVSADHAKDIFGDEFGEGMNMTIELRDVSYTYAGKYQRVTAVDTVSYTFQSGTMYSIMGASGSGKSTLLSLLAGLKLPTEGEIAFDEQPTCFMDRSALRRDTVSVIYQDFNLFPLLTAEENVCYPLRLRKEDKDQALALARQRLADMGIRESYFRKLPNQLSGGEQQRVAIARALAAGSYVILADEPTGNLDSGNSRMIVETLQRLAHQEKRCVIVVTHDPAVAAAADVQLRMQDGRLTQEEQQAEA